MTEEQSRRLEECLAYFKERPVYQKLFAKFRDKYASLGYAGGKVILTALKPEERVQLGGFFQKDYSENKSVTISATAMEKALIESKFNGITLEEILKEYFGEALTVKKEQKLLEEERRQLFFEEILHRTDEGIGKKWLKSLLERRGDGWQILTQQYKMNPAYLHDTLLTVLKSIQELPAVKDGASAMERELLAVFAARTTGNPHYYDEGMAGEKLLTVFLKDFAEVNVDENQELTRMEQKTRLLYEAGILKDDLSNDTMVYGIHAQKADGKLHEGIEGFCRMKEPVKITLLTLGKLQNVWAQNPKKNVCVVENPAVFSMLSRQYPEGTFICGNGQPRLATLLLMDMLKENHTFYYAGDFDPEGLLIAQRLKKRYGEKLILWNYREDWYEKYLSSVELDEVRLKKLEKIEISELTRMKEKMCQKKRAAYQEAMMEELQCDKGIHLNVEK